MRKIISVAALLLALTCPAYAGEMQNDSPKPPPSAVQEPMDDTTLNGEIPTPGDISTPSTSDILTETALDLLALLPSLF
jgi:hypothetical protein